MMNKNDIMRILNEMNDSKYLPFYWDEFLEARQSEVDDMLEEAAAELEYIIGTLVQGFAGCNKCAFCIPEWHKCIKFNISEEENAIDEENEIYQKAKDEGMESILIPNVYLGSIDNIHFYMQDLAIPLDESKDCLLDNIKELKTIEDKAIKEMEEKEIDPVIISATTDEELFNLYICKYYNLQRGLAILKFLYDNVGDLHTGNIGFIGFRPVIFDYASVYE